MEENIVLEFEPTEEKEKELIVDADSKTEKLMEIK
jgi:hypothetical protein